MHGKMRKTCEIYNGNSREDYIKTNLKELVEVTGD
jgi:hypothetical protein